MGESMVVSRHFIDGRACVSRYVYDFGAAREAAAYAIAQAAMSIQARTGYYGPVLAAPIIELEEATRRIVNDEADGSRLSSIGKA